MKRTVVLLIALLLIAASFAPKGDKGLAMATVRNQEDLELLGVSWWYYWSFGNNDTYTDCIPMVREIYRAVPYCPDKLLYLNEPNAVEPWGSTTPPDIAVDRLLKIEAQCPDTFIIAGNVSADDWTKAQYINQYMIPLLRSGYDWIDEFLHEYELQSGNAYQDAIGVHCYDEDSAVWCIKKLAAMRGLYDGEMWVTEYSITGGDARQFYLLTWYVAYHFDAYAAYTNRQPVDGYSYSIFPYPVDLVHGGELTEMGKVFAAFPAEGVR